MPRLRTPRTLLAALACTAVAAAAGAGATPALASHNQITFFEAPQQLLNRHTRARTISQLKWLGVSALRVELTWQNVAPYPNDKRHPSFNASNPGYYDWGPYEEVLREAHKLGWKVLLTVSAPAPRWATSNKRAPYVTNPDDRDFEEFMTAVARKFRSEVYLYAIWNEPNQPMFLRPQFNNKGQPVAPRIYRGLFQAGYRGLQRAGIGHPKVLMGEVQPDEKFLPNFRKGLLYDAVSPIGFLRGALCLNAHYRKAPTCGPLPAYGFSIHPYITAAGPYHQPPNPNDVTIGTLGRIVTALNRAGRAHAIKARLPLYLTEFGVRSKPEPGDGVPLGEQAAFDAISERIAWANPRVASFSQYLLQDAVLKTGPQTGLETLRGRKKPLYFGFPVQLTVTTLGAQGYALWGHVRAVNKPTTVTILIQRPHSRRYVRLTRARTNSLGYWKLRSKAAGSYWRVVWIGPHHARHEGPPIPAYSLPGLFPARASRHRGGRAPRRQHGHRRPHAASVKRGRARRR